MKCEDGHLNRPCKRCESPDENDVFKQQITQIYADLGFRKHSQADWLKFSVALLAVVSSCLLLLFLSYPAHEKVASHSHNYHPNDHHQRHFLHHNHNDDDLLMLFVCHCPISGSWLSMGFQGFLWSRVFPNR